MTWELRSLRRWEDTNHNRGEGTVAICALADCAKESIDDDVGEDDDDEDANVISLRCARSTENGDDATWCIEVDATTPTNIHPKGDEEEEEEEGVPRELMCVLSRIMVQSAAARIAAIFDAKEEDTTTTTSLLRITLPLLEGEGCQQLLLSDLLCPTSTNNNDDPHDDYTGVRQLFAPLHSQYATMEIVDMVDRNGEVLGSLPRPYVHTWNILHRGIGMIVSKDVDIFDALGMGGGGGGNDNMHPEVYVHQRTSTKRIFPSLYDMFVGGVSGGGEPSRWTAAREVAEELGLRRALDLMTDDKRQITSTTTAATTNNHNPLSEELFRCTICTSYNRCVVSMFSYTCDTTLERISWQEEEVAWGDYVPYNIVKVAGDMSIDRLMEGGVWPGTGDEEGNSNDNAIQHGDNASLVAKLKSKYDDDRPWETWDFVPDGLLVWQAWKSFLSQKTKGKL